MESQCETLGSIVPPQAANAKGLLFAGMSDDEYICAVDEQLRTVPILGEATLPV